ncbi:MAG: flagellar filament capping protein FliD [Planctomycetes bacterium]|nr:flagellar filament capping protein FliD [Planctomycetota bacterium]
MSGISSGIGLISGIDTASLIEQLMAIEARPVTQLQQRVQAIDVKRTAFLGLSAKILSLKNSALQFNKLSLFRDFNAPSTNENVITATVGEKAVPSSHTFRVRALATSHSAVSRGFADADTTPVGVGTLSIEGIRSRVDPSTELNSLKGGQGVRRGVITITDRAGHTADIDLSTAVTIGDVLEEINSNSTINVRARVTALPFEGKTGDRIVIEDLTAKPGEGESYASHLIIKDAAGGSMAADLGIVANAANSRIDGTRLVWLSESTQLSLLNDGNGVEAGGLVPDHKLTFNVDGPAPESFTVSLNEKIEDKTDLRALNSGAGIRGGVIRITDRAGQSVEVDLTDLDSGSGTTLGAVLTRLQAGVEGAGVAVNIALSNTSSTTGLLVTDKSNVDEDRKENLIIEDVSGFAAADLGIAANVDADRIQGRNIYRIKTVGDVLNAINYAPGNAGRIVRAQISADGYGITLKSLAEGSTVTVETGKNSAVADDLGINGATFTSDDPYESQRLIAGLNTVLLQSLRGGAGFDLGEVQFVDRNGNTTTIDFSAAETRPNTLADVIDLINADSNTGLVASINAAGNGIEIRDESDGAAPIFIADLDGGSFATQLGIAGRFDQSHGNTINGGNAQRQYISRATLLENLNAGRGIAAGEFRITDSRGAVHDVNLDANDRTIGHVIDAINSAGSGALEARINDNGDGILVIDLAEGTQPLTIEDLDGGQTAANLRLAGSAAEGQSSLDGSFEIHLEIGGADTLNEIIRKLNEMNAGVTASVLNDGGSVNPYSLLLSSEQSGRRGELIIDTTGFDLGFATMTKAQDAVLSTGDASSGTAMLITSSSNTVENIIPGTTLNLLATSDEDVTITISQDIDSIIDQINTFVDSYNAVQAAIDDATSFNSDTYERGPLAGESAVDQVRSRLYRTVSHQYEGVDPSFSRLFSVGLRFGSNNRLEFNEEDFREAYERSPELVEQLFTAKDTGFGAVIQDTIDGLTEDFDGLISRRNDVLADQQELLNKRIDDLEVLLAGKQARLEAQFVALESSLAILQDQQTSLTTLAELASSMSA